MAGGSSYKKILPWWIFRWLECVEYNRSLYRSTHGSFPIIPHFQCRMGPWYSSNMLNIIRVVECVNTVGFLGGIPLQNNWS